MLDDITHLYSIMCLIRFSMSIRSLSQFILSMILAFYNRGWYCDSCSRSRCSISYWRRSRGWNWSSYSNRSRSG